MVKVTITQQHAYNERNTSYLPTGDESVMTPPVHTA